MLMIMTFTGRPSSSADAGPAKIVATRTLAPASKHLVVDRAVSIILWPCMEGPPSGYRYLRGSVVATRSAACKAFFVPETIKRPPCARRGDIQPRTVLRSCGSDPFMAGVSGGRNYAQPKSKGWQPGVLAGSIVITACPGVNGAPGPMKMRTIASPWGYDVLADKTLQSANLRQPTISRYASLPTATRGLCSSPCPVF
jgi:hypothetical protein